MVREYQRGHDARRAPWHDRHGGPMPPEPLEDVTRGRSSRPMGVYEALRQVAKVPLKHFYLATILEDGRPVHFSSKPGPFEKEAEGFFSEELFLRRYEGAPSPPPSENLGGPGSPLESPYFPPSGPGMFGFEGDNRLRQSRRFPFQQQFDTSSMYDDDYLSGQTHYPKARKGVRGQRLRLGGTIKDNEDDALVIKMPTKRRGIKLGDSQDLWEFYESRFKSCQQSACKIIAKAWVKAIAPKKQTNNPYTGKDGTAPSWWPKPWGPSDTDKVRHKEPDHLYKKERMYLLNHLLRLIMEPPNLQQPEISKLGLSVAKIEEVTADALAPFYADVQNPTNASKKPYLDELFHVAKMEERYKHGGVDADTEVYVLADDGQDNMAEGYQSDNEDTTPVPTLLHSNPPRSRDSPLVDSTSSRMQPNPPAAPVSSSAISMQAILHQQPTPRATDHGPATTMPIPSGSYLSGMPSLRSLPSLYPDQPSAPSHSILQPDIPGASNHGYVDSGTSSTASVMVPNMHPPLHAISDMLPSSLGAGRRPSVLSPTDYASPSGTAVYSGGSWQQPTTTTSAPSSMYAFAAHQHGHPHGHPHGPPHHSPTQPPHSPFAPGPVGASTMHGGGQFMGSSFDNMPPYEPQGPVPDPMYRPTPSAHSSLPPPHAYGFMPGNRNLGGDSGDIVKAEGYSPGHHHHR